MKPRTHSLIAGLCVVFLGTLPPLGAQAQVVRCTDAATGKVTYTDGKCASGTTVREVEARKTPQEIQQEREEAAEALARKQQRLQAEATAAETESRRNTQREQTAPAKTTDYARSPECARSRRNLDVVLSSVTGGGYEQNLRVEAAQRQVDLDCLGPQGYAEVEKSRPRSTNTTTPVVVVPPPHYPVRPTPVQPPAPTPKKFTQCNVFRCYDAQGNSYPR
jgi:hypothetical protein